jgi:hypothetical protein
VCESRLIYGWRAKRRVQYRTGVYAEKGSAPVHRIPGVIWAPITQRTRGKYQVRAIWKILAAHDNNFHPIPVQLPTAYRSSHILFGRERTRLVHLTDHGHPCLPVQFPDHAAPFSHTQSGAAQLAAIVRQWARTVCSYESIDDRMTPPQ